MAHILICGFESGTPAQFSGDMYTSASELSTTTVRSGAYSLRSNTTTTGTSSAALRGLSATGVLTTFSSTTTYTRFYFRYAVKPTTNDEPILRCRTNVSTQKFELRLNSSGNLVAYDAANSILDTGASVLAADTWYRIELLCGSGATAAWEVRLKNCGPTGDDAGGAASTEISGTASLSSTNHGELQLGKMTNRNSNAVDFFFDDVSIRDDTWAGAGKIVRLGPNANGSTMQWTAGSGISDYTQVDEIPRAAGDFVQSTQVSNVALFAFNSAASAGISGTINCILASSIVAEASEGVSEGSLRIKSSSATSDSTAASLGTTAWDTRMRIADVDPNTSSAWTTGGIDAVEAGFLETANSIVRQRLAWISLFVDYQPTAGTGTTAVGQTGTLGAATSSATSAALKGVSLALYDEAGNLLGSTAGFYWFWVDRSRPIITDAIVDSGGPVSTDSNGIISATLSNTNLSVGNTGYMIITQTNGDPNQSPAPRGWQMPVVVTTGA